MSKFGCQVQTAIGKFCPFAKTYTEEQQDSGILCINVDCGQKMGSHTEKIVQPVFSGLNIYDHITIYY